MACIRVENVSLTYPIYGSSARSFKNTLLNATTGGRLDRNNKSVMVEALRDVSFTLVPGDRLALLGHNGAGKSTLLKVLAHIYEPTQGRVRVKGRMNCLFDIMMGMDHELNAYENILLRGLILGLKKSEVQAIVPRVEDFADLGDFFKMPIKTYSAGMKFRLAFGIITSIFSEIILIDEIVSVGDAPFLEKAKTQINHMVNQAESMVLASHDLHIVKSMCNKGLLLENGMTQFFGNIDEAIDKYQEKGKT
jgi:ABC-type polysaccharide/polyol phosphate transport system ATPase subunit